MPNATEHITYSCRCNIMEETSFFKRLEEIHSHCCLDVKLNQRWVVHPWRMDKENIRNIIWRRLSLCRNWSKHVSISCYCILFHSLLCQSVGSELSTLVPTVERKELSWSGTKMDEPMPEIEVAIVDIWWMWCSAATGAEGSELLLFHTTEEMEDVEELSLLKNGDEIIKKLML